MHFTRLLVVCIVLLGPVFASSKSAKTGRIISKSKSTGNQAAALPSEDICGVSVTSIKHGKFIEPADKNIFPWIARLGYTNASSIEWRCGGTLISPLHVLTSATCITKDLTTVRLGQQFAKGHLDIAIAYTTVHPNFKSKSNHTNLAVVELKDRVDFTKQIHPVCLPTAENSVPFSTDYSAPKPVAGSWGRVQNKERTASKELHAPQSLILPNEVCQEKYSQIDRTKYKGAIDETVFCAVVSGFDKDACLVDVGGPLLALRLDQDGVHRFHLIGVVSNDIGCGNVFMPRIYTRVQAFTEWIQKQTMK